MNAEATGYEGASAVCSCFAAELAGNTELTEEYLGMDHPVDAETFEAEASTELKTASAACT